MIRRRILMRLLAVHEDSATWCYHNVKLVKILSDLLNTPIIEPPDGCVPSVTNAMPDSLIT